MSQPTLAATYNSPTNGPFKHETQLPELGTDNGEKRVAYLSVLRQETAKLQDRINAELTQRMEEEKVQAEKDAGPGTNKRKVDDVAEEENYGEDVVEED